MSTFLSAGHPNELSVSIQTPHPGFRLEILRVDRLGERVQVLAQIHSPEDTGMMFPMVISEISDSVFLEAQVPGATVIVSGRGWGWGEEESVDSPEAYAARFPEAVPIPFSRVPPNKD